MGGPDFASITNRPDRRDAGGKALKDDVAKKSGGGNVRDASKRGKRDDVAGKTKKAPVTKGE